MQTFIKYLYNKAEIIISLIVISGGLFLSIWFYDWGHFIIIVGLLIIYITLAYMKLITPFFSLLFITLVFLMLAGSNKTWDLYNQYRLYDKLVHFTAEFALTLLSAHIITARKLITTKNVYIFLFIIVSIGITLGAVWEIIEWFINFFMPPIDTYTATDTAFDLMIDTCGVLSAGIIATFFSQYGRRKLFDF